MSDMTYKWRMDDGGWGIPPQTPSFFANSGNTQATLTWDVPETTEIDGQVVCRAKGIKILRKTGGYPEHENDGTVVVDSTNLTGSYTDTGLTNGTVYFYRAFAYSDHNVINRDPAAEGSVTPSEAAILTVTFPSVMNGQTVTATKGNQTVTGTVSNGSVTLNLASTGTWNVCGRDFTVDTLGASYSLNIPIFAFHYSENDSSPASVSYPAGYTNSGYTDTFAMDLSTGVPSYGDWNPAGANADDVKMLYPKSCMLKFDGTVDYYLDEDDETKKEDGVTASDVANSSYSGNAMVEWGQDGVMRWKIVPDSDGKGFTFVITNADVLDCQPWNHYDANGDITPHFYTPKYFGSNVSSKLRSISGTSGMVSQTRNTEVTYARANNVGSDIIWDTEVYADWLLLAMLCCLISKSTNSQAKFGSGRCASSNSSAIANGTMNGKGMFYGKSNQTEGVKVFGMENVWGNLWRGIRGLVTVAGSVVKVKLTHGTQDGSEASDYNFDGTGYLTRSAITGTSGGYTNAMDINEKGLTPKTVSGSESTYYTDGCWFAANCYALVDGSWDVAGRVGAFCVNLIDAASATYAYYGSALSCKPLAGA